MTTQIDTHPAVALSQTELRLLDAGENMDKMIDEAADMLALYGDQDEDYLKLAELERAARAAFKHWHRMAVRERRLRGVLA